MSCSLRSPKGHATIHSVISQHFSLPLSTDLCSRQLQSFLQQSYGLRHRAGTLLCMVVHIVLRTLSWGVVICLHRYTLFFFYKNQENRVEAQCSYFYDFFSLKMFLFCSYLQYCYTSHISHVRHVPHETSFSLITINVFSMWLQLHMGHACVIMPYFWVFLSYVSYPGNLRHNCTKIISLVWAQPRFVLNLFLFSGKFQHECSYKIALI